MAGDNDSDKKGFSGLSDLASEISGVDEPIKPEPKKETKPSTAKQPPQPERPTATSEQKSKTTRSSVPSVETQNSGKSGGDSGSRWILGIIGFVFMIWLFNNGEPRNKNPSYNSSSSSQKSANTANVAQSARLNYSKPSVGTNNVLSVAEIRWCVKEGIRTEAMRNIINTNRGIEEFNQIINDYNSRCGRYQYRKGSQSRAERDVDPYRNQIEYEAIQTAKKLNNAYKSSYSNTALNAAPKSKSQRVSNQQIGEVQKLLYKLDYNPGPIDGQYGVQTASAIKYFQMSMGLTVNGRIDQNLISTLRQTLNYKISQRLSDPYNTKRTGQSHCQYKPIMTDEDYYACGITPPR